MTVSASRARGRCPRWRRPATRPRATSVTALRAWVVRSVATGPRVVRPSRSARTPAATYSDAATVITRASDLSEAPPASTRRPTPRPPPLTAEIVPAVGDIALAVNSSPSGTTCGSDADSADNTNRLTDRTVKAETKNQVVPAGEKTTAATIRARRPRRTLATNRICRRCQRSIKTPANGPRNEYGSRTTANAAATEPPDACRSGEKNAYEASATWNTPSDS